MNLYLISQTSNGGYDTHDAAVVVACNEEEARLINPEGKWGRSCSSWCEKPEQVEVKYIGIADEVMTKGIVLASFNAG